MALRLLQIVMPGSAEADVQDSLNGREVVARWRDERDPDCLILHLLVPAEETEPVMDKVEQRCKGIEGFHVILLPTEAVLPRPKPEETPAESETAAAPTRPALGIRVSREELYAEVTESMGVTRIFVGMTALSAIVAVIGLVRDDLAVIIGAMVIAPLLGPNVAFALATTLGDMDLARRALRTNAMGVLVTLVVAIAAGIAISFDPHVAAIATRTQVGASDIVLALAAGAAGTLAYTSGFSGAVIGVMVAVALLPPLAVFGMLLGAGQLQGASGAFLLAAANLICVNLAGVGTFLLQGVRPRTWWEAKRAQKASRTAALLWFVLLVLLGLILLFTHHHIGLQTHFAS